MGLVWKHFAGKQDRLIALLAVALLSLSLLYALNSEDKPAETTGKVFYNLPADGLRKDMNLVGQAARLFGPERARAGDVNRDGNVDERDESLMQRFAQKQTRLTGPQEVLADLNKDGSVNHLDIMIMRDYLAGRIGALPVLRGDIDLDGEVDVEDARLLSEFLEGYYEFSMDQLYLADVTGNGRVDEWDKKELVRKIG